MDGSSNPSCSAISATGASPWLSRRLASSTTRSSMSCLADVRCAPCQPVERARRVAEPVRVVGDLVPLAEPRDRSRRGTTRTPRGSRSGPTVASAGCASASSVRRARRRARGRRRAAGRLAGRGCRPQAISRAQTSPTGVRRRRRRASGSRVRAHGPDQLARALVDRMRGEQHDGPVDVRDLSPPMHLAGAHPQHIARSQLMLGEVDRMDGVARVDADHHVEVEALGREELRAAAPYAHPLQAEDLDVARLSGSAV